jgi:serine/threonine-protein kinase
LLDALKPPGTRGGTLRVAADADWALPPTLVRSAGSWRIVAEPGPTRPRLRFLPAVSEARASVPWTTMLDLRAGGLVIEGFDIILPRSSVPREGRWAAFAAWPATDLSLTGCTVTVEGKAREKEREIDSAVVAVGVGDSDDEPGLNAPEPSAATVRLENGLFRTGGDLVDVSSGRRLVLEVTNAVVATDGSLVHGHGLPRGQPAEPLSITLRQVTARTRGGLVQLESAAGEPELPVAEVNARDSVFATSRQGAPLLRVDGQDAPGSLRDRVRWEGHGNSYHQVNVYRRDQSSQVGSLPTVYDRSSWTMAVGPRESSPMHGDLKFLHEWDPDRGAWNFRRDDAELAPDSPVRSTGPVLDRIPNPPLSS